MTTEKPLTRREIRERERAQFEHLAATSAQLEVPAAPIFTPHPVAPARRELPSAAAPFDPQPVVLTPPPVEAIAPADVLAPQLFIDQSFIAGPPPVPSQRITEIPVPDAAAPWPAWASKPVEIRHATAAEVAPDFIAAAAPDLVELASPHEQFAAELPVALMPEAPAVEAGSEVFLDHAAVGERPRLAPHPSAPTVPAAIADSTLAASIPTAANLAAADRAAADPAGAAWAASEPSATVGTAPARTHRTRPTAPLAPRRAPQPAARKASVRQGPGQQAAASASRARAAVPKSTAPSLRRRVMAKVFSTAALLFAGALLVGSSIPANAFMQNTVGEGPEAFAETKAGQTMSVADGAAELEGSARDGSYDVISPAELLAKKYGGNSDDYSAATTGSIRWPFPYSVSTSDGFGPRAAPCGGCSTFHNGLDFLPGNGKPIYAVAAGTVSYHAMDGSLGNKVELEHVINGQPVQSVYAHMQLGSSPLQVGDKVKVGQFIGLVGATGIATAPHLHLEIHLAGVPVNPYAWLTANVN